MQRAAEWRSPKVEVGSFEIDAARSRARLEYLFRGLDEVGHHDSAEQRAPQTFKDPAGNLRFRAGFGSKAGPNEAQTIRQVPTNWHTTIPNDSGTISACFDEVPKLLNCEIAQPRFGRGGSPRAHKRTRSADPGFEYECRERPAMMRQRGSAIRGQLYSIHHNSAAHAKEDHIAILSSC